jgi:serine/threonine-protein kinase
MGGVYLAECRVRDGSPRQLVALKILRHDAPALARRLFYHEGTLLPRLRHQHIVRAVECGRGAIDDTIVDYLALDFIAGETLEGLLRKLRRPFSPETVLGIVAQIGRALSYLHARGITHCDLKPGNIMLERAAPRAILIDFGIARAPDFVGEPVAVGTPQYMAPEQADPRAACDGRADIYALGVLTCELLSGRRLFPNRTAADVRRGVMLAPRAEDLCAFASPAIVQVLLRCLAAHPADRYASVETLIADLSYSVQQGIAAQTAGPEEARQ